MYGFDVIVNGINRSGDIQFNNVSCYNRMIPKFENDKVFSETEKYIIILDGVILNKSILQREFVGISWEELIVFLYEAYGETFFSKLKGSFAGMVLDKTQGDKIIVFSDQIGSRFTYYAQVGDFFCATEEMGHIYSIMKENKVSYSLSEEGAYMLLSYGFMLEDKTICEQVKKIQPGCYIVYENNKVLEKRYYILDNTPDDSIKENSAIEIIDEYFRKAVVKEFEKDREYGYKHIVALSGGLDSRMTSFVAHDCGYREQLNFTFSQTNYWDETIPQKIAEDLKHEWIFKALDNGLWLHDVEEITGRTGGNVLFYGTAHGNSLYKLLNFDKHGIIHTGQISGGLNGSHVTDGKKWNEPFDLHKAAYSNLLISKVKTDTTDLNQELGWYYYRCLNGTNNGSQAVYNYTETLSPFLEYDFLEQLLKIPVLYRIGNNLYKKWITNKYPNAAKYVCESLGTTINAPVLKIGSRSIPYNQLWRSLKSHIRMSLGLPARSSNSRKGMNPISYYYNHNEELREHLNSYIEWADAINDNELRNDVINLMQSGKPMERIQAVSLLAAVKLFFNK